MSDRKLDHINLAFEAQVESLKNDPRFYYEPLLSKSPDKPFPRISFLNKELGAPIWVSSMTGGTEIAQKINRNLALASRKFGLGMGLGSCRKLLNSKDHWNDFDLRDAIGESQPFYANLGIAQVEELLRKNNFRKIEDLVGELKADGLIIHVNPSQEWFQPEGDRLLNAPIDTISELLQKLSISVIVKEVGQGMGPQSLKRLMKLPLAAIEFGAFGGTNFSKLELLRRKDKQFMQFEPLTYVGHPALEMVNFVNDIVDNEKDIQCKQVIISGGVKNFLNGYYLLKKCRIPAVYGQASEMLKHAQNDLEELECYLDNQIKGLQFAEAFLRIKEDEPAK